MTASIALVLYTPFIVPTDQMGKVEVSFKCLHGNLAVNHLQYKDTG